jgi:hypothetical protein
MWRLFYVVDKDPTYSIRFILSQIETNLAIVAASAPPLWPLARSWFPSMDAKLGINDPHFPDIEVKFSPGDSETETLTRPMRVKVTWTNSMTPPLTDTNAEGESRDGALESPQGSGRRVNPGYFASEREARSDSYHSALTEKGDAVRVREL